MTNTPYEYQGVKGLQNIADFTGISYTTLKNRVGGRNKMSIDEAVALGGNTVCKHKYQGVVGIRNIVEAFGEKFGVTKGVIENRLLRGWDLKSAVETPALRKRKHTNKPAKPKPLAVKKSTKKFVGIKFPTELNPLWMLALGVKHNA